MSLEGGIWDSCWEVGGELEEDEEVEAEEEAAVLFDVLSLLLCAG